MLNTNTFGGQQNFGKDETLEGHMISVIFGKQQNFNEEVNNVEKDMVNDLFVKQQNFDEEVNMVEKDMGNDIVRKQQNFDNEHKVEKHIAILVKPAVVYFGPPSASEPENFTSDEFVRSASSDGADSAGDIGLLVAQFGCSPDDAALALNANEKDLVDAMFALASKGSRPQTKRDEG